MERGRDRLLTARLLRLDDAAAITLRLDPSDMHPVFEAGFAVVIDNRPTSDRLGAVELRAAALAAGLVWYAIPIVLGRITPRELHETRAASRLGPVLALCATGGLACMMWALARAADGESPNALINKAAAIGCDLRPLHATLQGLSGWS